MENSSRCVMLPPKAATVVPAGITEVAKIPLPFLPAELTFALDVIKEIGTAASQLLS